MQYPADKVALITPTEVRGKLGPYCSFCLRDPPCVIGQLVCIICGKAHMLAATNATYEMITQSSLRKSSCNARLNVNPQVHSMNLAIRLIGGCSLPRLHLSRDTSVELHSGLSYLGDTPRGLRKLRDPLDYFAFHRTHRCLIARCTRLRFGRLSAVERGPAIRWPRGAVTSRFSNPAGTPASPSRRRSLPSHQRNSPRPFVSKH